VIVTEGLLAEPSSPSAARTARSSNGAISSPPENSPEASKRRPACRPNSCAAPRAYATGGNAAIYYGLGVTEHAQGSTTVMGIANLAMATGNIGREGVGVNRCAARTTCRARATWARSRTSCRAIAMCRTRRCGSSRPGA
jgi:formate dehydrogenase major subunit